MRKQRIICLWLSLIIAITALPLVMGSKVYAASDEEKYWKSYSTDINRNMFASSYQDIYDLFDKAYMDVLLSDGDFTYVVVDVRDLNFEDTPQKARFFSDMAYLVRHDNPAYFFATSKVSFTQVQDSSGKKYIKKVFISLYPDFKNGSDRKKAKEEIRNGVESYIGMLSSDMRPEEAEKTIHDLICENVTYGTYVTDLGTNMDQNIYSAIKNKSVCTGYSVLFEAIMNRIGITCTFTRSDTHAWNFIYLYGYWYCVDVTHDDLGVSGISYKKYNCQANIEAATGKPYVQTDFYKRFIPPNVKYDCLDEKTLVEYSPRYFNTDGNTYFVINDLDNEMGLIALLIKTDDKGFAVSSVEYNKKTYSVITNKYSEIPKDPTTTPTSYDMKPENTIKPSNSAVTGSTSTPTPAPQITIAPVVVEETGFAGFVERLYNVALGRLSEAEGKAFWCTHVGNGDLTGAECANEFLLSAEFKGRNLNDTDFLRVLYKTFFDRNAEDDPDGFSFWMNSLKTVGRESVVDGFINSTEWCNVCASFGVRSGATRAKATIASENAKAFSTRLYTECLGREPEKEGLDFWSLGLTNQELTGTQAAKNFFYSAEFINANYSDDEYINRLYKTFMGRDPETEGKTYWLDQLSKGMTRDEVFDSFSTSKEFVDICKTYAIQR